jgi:hypothetical protein
MISYTDGRDTALNKIRKLQRHGPQRPKDLRKRAAADVDVAAVNDMLLTTEERALRSNATATVQVIKSLHGNRSLPFTAATIGEGELVIERDNRKSVKAIRTALRKPHGIGATAHRQVNIGALERQLRKSFNDYTYTISDGRVINKMLTTARPRVNDRGVTDDYNRGAPQSSNAQWDNTHAATGATNDWHDQIAPSTKPARIAFHQFGTPGRSSRDDAIEAIRQDLTKPKRMGASPNTDDSFARER